MPHPMPTFCIRVCTSFVRYELRVRHYSAHYTEFFLSSTPLTLLVQAKNFLFFFPLLYSFHCITRIILTIRRAVKFKRVRGWIWQYIRFAFFSIVFGFNRGYTSKIKYTIHDALCRESIAPNPCATRIIEPPYYIDIKTRNQYFKSRIFHLIRSRCLL